MSAGIVVLKPRKARPFFARHPWVLASSVARTEGDLAPGAEVTLRSHEGAFIARGLYNPNSMIRVRLFRWDDGPLDEPFWRARIREAIHLRRAILDRDQPGSACRLVYSESDGLPGLSVDRYDRWLVAQFTSLALFERRETLLAILAEETGAEGVFLRTERGIAALEGLDLGPQEAAAWGTLPASPIEIEEHGLRYQVDPRAGQKTGFYLDQRDNRLAAARYAAGRRVLDLFCYTGGFSLCALAQGKAAATLGIDTSPHAVELARANADRNGLAAQARFETADIADALARLRAESQRFDMIVCDPPKFARTARAVDEALRGYLRLNLGCLDLLRPDGVLVTCSCSGHIDRAQFAQVLSEVAVQSGRSIQILELRGQAPDHPVAATCLETDYLKCAICRVS